jgi:ElaB/YqjD/DUF883 family membrane-anchored ribosome-binding protein
VSNEELVMTDPSAGSTTDQVKQQAREGAEAVQAKAGSAFGQARGRLREQIDQRSTNAGEQVHSTANDVRSVAEELRRQGKETPARLAEQVADRVDSFGSYLRNADGERMLGDVERYARRQPWAVAAGAVALGFVASRFLKASSGRRYESSAGRGDESSATTEQFRSPDGGIPRASEGSRVAATPPVVETIPEPVPETLPEKAFPVDDRYASNRYPEG